MQKWEYIFVACGYHNHMWRPQHVNGQELNNWQSNPSISEYSNKLGDEGWEMVNFITNGAGGFTYNYRFVFKRTK